MPIRPELRKFYGKEWRTVIRPRILARAQNRCELCRKPNRKMVDVRSGRILDVPVMIWRLGRRWFWRNGLDLPLPLLSIKFAASLGPTRRVEVVLTVAHLNHRPGDDRDENLKALCQWCHLNYDRLHHKETRCTRKDAARPLLAGAA